MALNRGLAARGLSSIFYTYRNSINIYTEDANKNKKFYTLLLQRLLDGTGIVVNDIHPLGNCEQVIQHCKNDSDTTMPKLYIIDGDIYLMTTPRPAMDHLYVLDAYCMENKVIDENAYYKVLDSLDPFHTLEEIKEKAEFNTMINDAENPFLKLHYHMAVSNELIKHHYLKSAREVMRNGSISIEKVEDFCKEIKDNIVKYGGFTEEIVDNEVNKKMVNIPPSRSNLMKYVSGKDYLVVYIDEYTRTRLNAMAGQKKEFWKFQFSKYCDLTPLEGLKRAIVKEVKDFNDYHSSASNNTAI